MASGPSEAVERARAWTKDWNVRTTVIIKDADGDYRGMARDGAWLWL